MDFSKSQHYYVLLMFKDLLPESTGRGFPLVSKSPTIAEQHAVARRERRPRASKSERPKIPLSPETQLDLSPTERSSLSPHGVKEGYTVWGWWRKPWEFHPTILEFLDNCSQHRGHQNVLFYNPYFTRIYHAKLQAIYYQPFLTSVAIPSNWRNFSPKYYRNEPRLCGVFLSLKIDSKEIENPKKFLSQLFVDSASFELRPYGLNSVIPVPEGIAKICSEMVDQPPDRSSLRGCEHTMLLLRDFNQEQHTRGLLEKPSSCSDNKLAEAFIETAWNGIQKLLRDTSPLGWKNLSNCPRAILEIGKKATDKGSRITRLDLELFAHACACQQLGNLLVEENGENERFTELGKSLVQWVTSLSAREARETAAKVLRLAWNTAAEHYGLSDLSGYFETLPAMEAVASAVQHEIGKKFYRDHLSHNVRSALLSVRLVSDAEPPALNDINPYFIAFFSGLFHDIAFPVSAFPETTEKLAKALSSLRMCDEHFRGQGLLDTNALKRSLSYVAELACVPKVVEVYKDKLFAPWDKPDDALQPINKRLFQELMLCANSEEHAIISSAILFDQAVLSRCGGIASNYDTGLRTLMVDMTGVNAKPKQRELLAILQCIALHDRKVASKFHGVSTVPHDTPAKLAWEEFWLPVIVSIADEMQEWGRPVGMVDGIGAVDGSISLKTGEVDAKLTLTSESSTFTNVPYSLLEAGFGKFRTMGRIMYVPSPGQAEQAIRLRSSMENLGLFRIEYLAHKEFRLEFLEQFSPIDFEKWPREGDEIKSIAGEENEHLVCIKTGSSERPAYDYIAFSGDQQVCAEAVALVKQAQPISEVSFEGKKVRVVFLDGTELHGSALAYWFGRLDTSRCVPAGGFQSSDPCAFLRVNLIRIVKGLENGLASATPHLRPHPHIRDYDWRFTARTAKWIVETSLHYANGGHICYLGCPTVAMYHRILLEEHISWVLLDKGHYALEKWINSIISAERYIQYNVFDSLEETLLAKYSLVVTDPPWYKNEYKAFCRRAVQLVRDGGFICVSNYPPFPPYMENKHNLFNQIIKDEFGDSIFLGSFEIDYEIPDFERSWSGHKEFEHTALGVYRPAYMDLYQVIRADREERDDIKGQAEEVLPSVYPMQNGHYLRYIGDRIFPCVAKIYRRRTVHREEPLNPDIVAWSTRNLVVKKSNRGVEVKNVQSLVKVIEEWETNRT